MSLLHTIALTFIKGVGPISTKMLIAKYRDSENIFKERLDILAKTPKIGNAFSGNRVLSDALARAEEEMNFARKNNIRIYSYLDKEYPYRLQECEDAPIILYQYGSRNLNEGHVLAVVGTRNITPYGRELTSNLVSQTADFRSNMAIVSGLAYGVDGAAHRAALKENIPTIAVVAHGLDRVYPAQHKGLAASIVQQGGAIITEYSSKTKPDAPNFVQRNRIIAGISDAVVVVESAEKGGALLTADAANSYNRDVFAFAGRTDDVFSVGCNNLIKSFRAQMITCADDIFLSMGWNHSCQKPQTELFPEELMAEESDIVAILRKKPTEINELSRMVDIPIQKLISTLILLEFKGVVKALPGNIYKA